MDFIDQDCIVKRRLRQTTIIPSPVESGFSKHTWKRSQKTDVPRKLIRHTESNLSAGNADLFDILAKLNVDITKLDHGYGIGYPI